MTYVQLYSELLSYVPALSPLLAKKLVNRARRDIYDERPWSFLLAEGQLMAPAAITDGAVDATYGSQTLTLDSTANAALNGLTNPVVTRRQIRLGGGPLYNISAYSNGSSTVTIDRAYGESTDTGLTYSVYQAYYSPPETDFLRWVSIYDPVSAYVFKLNWTQAQLNQIDPFRTFTQSPYVMASYGAVPSGFWDNTVAVGSPLYEMWPHPLSQRTYRVAYQQRGTDFSADTDTLPTAIPDELLMLKARKLAYEWGLTSGEASKADYKTVLALVSAEYGPALKRAKRQDEEVFIQTWMGKYNNRVVPYSSDWLRAHDWPSTGW